MMMMMMVGMFRDLVAIMVASRQIVRMSPNC